MRKTHLIVLHIIIVIQGLNAGEWTSFRGPQGTGVTQQKDVPIKWNSNSIVWKTDLPGVGQSSPVHWDGKLFLTTATNGGKIRHTICVNKASGKILWNQSVPSNSPEDVHRMNTHATPSCVTDGERVISFFGPAGMHCYDLNGNLQWSRTDLGDFPGAWELPAHQLFWVTRSSKTVIPPAPPTCWLSTRKQVRPHGKRKEMRSQREDGVPQSL